MIAYDFDGVLITDYDQIDSLTDEQFFDVVGHSCPMFQPQGDYIVITARSPERRKSTMNVLNKLDNPPVSIYFREDQDCDPGEYKAGVLNSLPDIEVFVESSKTQANTISSIWQGKVIHFSSQINKSLQF